MPRRCPDISLLSLTYELGDQIQSLQWIVSGRVRPFLPWIGVIQTVEQQGSARPYLTEPEQLPGQPSPYPARPGLLTGV